MYSVNTDATYPYKPPRYGQYGEGKPKLQAATAYSTNKFEFLN